MRHGRDWLFPPRFIRMTALVTSPGGRPVAVPVGPLELPGTLAWPAHPSGIVLFAHGSGSSRSSPRNIAVANQLRSAGLATLLFDLLTPEEAEQRGNVFEIPVLAERLRAATEWVVGQAEMAGLMPGYFGASTGAAAALRAAAGSGVAVGAVVSRGGRPDLAGDALPAVRAPTLLIVGGHDQDVLELNRLAFRQLTCMKQLVVVAGATHLFEEPGTLEEAGRLAAGWFVEHLAMAPRWRAPHR
jgi:putative phosphoribosyl transferase